MALEPSAPRRPRQPPLTRASKTVGATICCSLRSFSAATTFFANPGLLETPPPPSQVFASSPARPPLCPNRMHSRSSRLECSHSCVAVARVRWCRFARPPANGCDPLRARTPKTNSWTRRSGSWRTKRSSDSMPRANSRWASAIGMLVQHEPEVCRWAVLGGNGEEHGSTLEQEAAEKLAIAGTLSAVGLYNVVNQTPVVPWWFTHRERDWHFGNVCPTANPCLFSFPPTPVRKVFRRSLAALLKPWHNRPAYRSPPARPNRCSRCL